MKRCLFLLAVAALAVNAPAQSTDDADTLLDKIQQAVQPPKPPAEWAGRVPSPEELAKFRAKQAEAAGLAADLATEFLTRFPAHAKAAEVLGQQYETLANAVHKGATNRLAQLEKVEGTLLADPKMSSDDKFRLRMRGVDRRAGLKQAEGPAAMLAEFEKGARALQKEFPDRNEVFEMLYAVAMRSDGPKAAAIAKEIAASGASAEVKEAATALLKKSERLGKAIKLEFTALDGRKVDLAKLKGKVVLVDFWATWCGPCVAELPNVKAAYTKLHDKGFEVIGISLDDDKAALEALVKHKQLPWPQFFESEKSENRYAKEFDISAIPAMWLIDKEGKLVDTNARDGLEKKVEKLLAETKAAK